MAERVQPEARDASTGELISRLSEQTSTLIRDEMRRAQAEFSAKAKHAGTGVGMFGTGGLLAFFSVAALITTAILAVMPVLKQVLGSSGSQTLEPVVSSLATAPGAGLALILGLATALWSASGYVTAFSRAMNRVYQIGEGRPIWQLRPAMLLITLVMVLLVVLVALMLVLSG